MGTRAKALLPLSMIALFGALLLSSSDRSLADDHTEPSSNRWSIVGAHPNMILLNSNTGVSYHLKEEGERFIWSAILKEDETAAQTINHWPPGQKLMKALSGQDSSRYEDEKQNMLGIKLAPSFKDPGFGLVPGDVISHVNRLPIRNMDDLQSSLLRAGLNHRRAVLAVLRGDRRIDVIIDD